MGKGSAKTLGIVFVIVLIALLIAHLMAMRTARAEFAKKEQSMTQQIAELNKKVDTISMEKQVLKLKLELNAIRMQVAENNFGTAKDSLNAFKEYLKKSGCKKLAELTPVFDEIDTNLLKKKDMDVKAGLDKVEAIIFGSNEAAEPAAEESEK